MKYVIALLVLIASFPYMVDAQGFEGKMELVNLGRKVNTGYHEAGPVVSPDGRTIYFFVHNHPENTYGKEGSQDVWFSTKNEDGSWSEARHMDRPLNIHRSNQIFGVLEGGKVLFVRGGSRKNSKGFSFLHKTGAGWSEPRQIDIEGFKDMNKGKYYGATISTDGSTIILYFSERENSHFSDLYISRRQSDASYSRPEKIPGLNTGRDEFAPFLAPDDKTLYFSSSRKDMGEGSADIYVTRRKSGSWTNWTAPENLGRPVNTRAFDAYLSVDQENNFFVTQSGRTIDGGNLDIFQLEQRAYDISMKGMIADAETGAPLQGEMHFTSREKSIDTVHTNKDRVYMKEVSSEDRFSIHIQADGYQPFDTVFHIGKIEQDSIIYKDFNLLPNEQAVMFSGIMYDAESGDPITGKVVLQTPAGNPPLSMKADASGYYEKELAVDGWYMITGTAEGYMNANDSIYNSGDQNLLQRDLYLEPVQVGTTVVLNNIFFDFDKTTLKTASYTELNTVLDFLETNPNVYVEIAGHTDNKGSHEYNESLSQGRAQAVVDYLIDQGIEDLRLVAKGYGETAPIASNASDEGRAINRRVEFTVLSINDALQP